MRMLLIYNILGVDVVSVNVQTHLQACIYVRVRVYVYVQFVVCIVSICLIKNFGYMSKCKYKIFPLSTTCICVVRSDQATSLYYIVENHDGSLSLTEARLILRGDDAKSIQEFCREKGPYILTHRMVHGWRSHGVSRRRKKGSAEAATSQEQRGCQE
jgi:hypothetical protein